MSEMGDRIRLLRKKSGMTQEELGEKLGVSKTIVNRYESGIIENIKRSSIEIMCKLFNVSASYLLGIEELEDSLAKEVKLIEQIQEFYGKEAVDLLQLFTQLNAIGKEKVISYCDDMTEIQKYVI